MTKRAISFLALPLLTMALVLMALQPMATQAASPSHSQHHSHHTPHYFFKHHKVKPFAGGNLIYNGGPVMEGTSYDYAIFWEPTGSVSPNYNSLIQRYFGDVGGSSLYNNNTQYTDSSGAAPNNSVFAGSWVDTSPYPESPLLDSDIQNEVSNAQNANGWSSSNNNIFFVFTEQNANICFDQSQSQCASNAFCAYHSYFGSNTIYAAMPYAASFSCQTPGSPNNDDADLTINVTSHEQMEAATDPLLNAWTDSGGQEIGDKCAWQFGNLNPDGSNVNWNGNPYIVQQEWDNAQSGCVLAGP